MDEAEENVDNSVQNRDNLQQKVGHQQKGGRKTGDFTVKNSRLPKRSLPENSTVDQTKIEQKQMETAKQQIPQQNETNSGIYPTIRSETGNNEQQIGGQIAAMNDGEGGQRGTSGGGGHGQINQQMGNKNSTLEKDRQKEATELANNAAQKHAKYYDGTLHSLSGTFPVQKSVSTFNRIKGSNESTEQTVDRWIQGLHTIDFGISFLVWRTFFFAKDFSAGIYDKAGQKGNGFVRMLTNSSLPMTIALVLFSPIIFGSLFFIVPAIFFMLAILLIPALFVIPTVFFFIFIFNLLPFTNKRARTFAKNSFGRIPIFNRSQKAEGREGEEMRTTMAYQKAH